MTNVAGQTLALRILPVVTARCSVRVILSCALTVFLFGSVALSAGRNLLANGAFEKGKPPWHGNFELDLQVAKQGFQSVRVDAQGGGESTIREPGIYGMDPGKPYDLSLWIKTRDIYNPNGVVVQIMQWRSGKQLGWVRKDYSPLLVRTGGTRDWTEYRIELPLFHPETISVALYLKVLAGNRGTVWFDDIRLHERSPKAVKARGIESNINKGNLVVDGGFEKAKPAWQGGRMDKEVFHTGRQSVGCCFHLITDLLP